MWTSRHFSLKISSIKCTLSEDFKLLKSSRKQRSAQLSKVLLLVMNLEMKGPKCNVFRISEKNYIPGGVQAL